MTRKQTAEVLAAISSAYPNHDRFASEQAVEGMAAVWSASFADDDAKLVQLAVAKHIQTNKWPPSIAEIREIMVAIQCPDLIPPDEAWAAVSDLLYATGEFSERPPLPELVEQAVNAVDWHTLRELRRQSITGGKPGLDRVAFMDIYKPLHERQRQRLQTAASVRDAIDTATAALSGDGRRAIEAAHQKRKDQEEFYRKLASLEFNKNLLTTAEDPDDTAITTEKEEPTQ